MIEPVRVVRALAVAVVLLPGTSVSAQAADASSFARLVAGRYHVDARHVVTADIDHDGDLDVVVSTDRGFLIWVNDGAGRFTSAMPEHRPMINGQPPADTWEGTPSSQDATIPTSAPSIPLAADRANAPPSLSSRSAILTDIVRRVELARGSCSPRAPPLDS